MSIKYPLHDLTWQEFESLVILICDKVLGIATLNFSSGKDGGRDGVFSGRAETFPSTQKPWDGKFIIQAKHTENPIASCSDADFKAILEKEVLERLTVLVKEDRVNYYLVFTNRKLSGLAQPKVGDFITTNLEIESSVIGVERIQLYLREYPEIAKALDLNKLLLPFQFYEKDLVDLINEFAKNKKGLRSHVEGVLKNIRWIDKEKKNEINNLSKDYFEFMKKQSLPYFTQIEKFLKDEKNRVFREMYENTVADLQEKVLVNRSDFVTFEEILSAAYDYIITNSKEELSPRRRLVRVFLHYMYFNCDIGLLESNAT